jgi:cob(I)alamin adenosyltransferase
MSALAARNPVVTTRRGDHGRTSLRYLHDLSKDDPLLALLGDLDEANAALGVARAQVATEPIGAALLARQGTLYQLMAALSDMGGPTPSPFALADADVAELERLVEAIRAVVPLGRSFITPGATPAGAAIDLARTILRRAERSAVALRRAGAAVDDVALRYLNRVGDYAFLLARYEEHLAGRTPDRPRPLARRRRAHVALLPALAAATLEGPR